MVEGIPHPPLAQVAALKVDRLTCSQCKGPTREQAFPCPLVPFTRWAVSVGCVTSPVPEGGCGGQAPGATQGISLGTKPEQWPSSHATPHPQPRMEGVPISVGYVPRLLAELKGAACYT